MKKKSTQGLVRKKPKRFANELLYLDEPSSGLSIRDGRLIVKVPPIEMGVGPQNHGLQCVILAAPGFVTTGALAWLAAEHVAVFIVWEGEFLTIVNAAGGQLARRELATRRRQMECVLDPARRLNAARALVEAKIKTLKLTGIERKTFAGKVAKAGSIEDAMVV